MREAENEHDYIRRYYEQARRGGEVKKTKRSFHGIV